MGGSDSRCCVDSEEKTLQECAVGYTPATHLQSPFQSTKIVRMDPRSPSSRVDRTPIQVYGTPSGHPKPLMRVQPMKEREPVESSTEKQMHANNITSEAALLDPRSPAAHGSRTPILLESKRYDVMRDPRSPTMGIVRTPLLGESSAQSPHEGAELKEGNGSCNWAICQTPQKHVYATTDTSETAGETFQGVFDPRSPSDGIDRTPLGKLQEQDDVFSSNAANGHIDCELEVVKNVSDPRSPSEGIERTPVGNIHDQDIASISVKCADDHRSSKTEISRTPLGAIFSGRRELRRTVLLSNALLASPLTKKITHSSANKSQSPDLELDRAESTANRNFLDLPNRNFNESRSSSVVAVLGSDVDSLSNLDESIDESHESSILNVVDVSQVEEMDQDLSYDCISGKHEICQDSDSSNKVPQTNQSYDHVNNVISHHIVERRCNALLKTSTCQSSVHRTTTLASECGSSVDADEGFVTAKFSALSTDEEYQSSQEVNDPVRPLKSDASSSYDVVSPLFDESTTANINFVTTYEILDDDKDACAITANAKPVLAEAKVNLLEDEFQTPDSTTNLPCTNNAECGMTLQSGDDNFVTRDTTASFLNNNSRVGETAVDETSGSVEETNQDKTCGVALGSGGINYTEALMGSEGVAQVQNYSAIEDKISQHDSSESSASREGFKQISDENSRSDSEPHIHKNTPTTENLDKKKPKRRLRTPKAVTRKHRHISTSTKALSTCSFGLEATKPKSLSNFQLSRTGMSLDRNAQIPSEVLDGHKVTAPRSPLAVLTNDFSKSYGGKVQKNQGTQSATKLPRYRGTPKTARSLSGSFGGQSAKRKTVRNKEN